MLKVLIKRHEYTDEGTFGTLTVYRDLCTFSFPSIELPWRDNKTKLSCIPKGVYLARWSMSVRFKKMLYELLNVPNRSGIRIHVANWAGDKMLGKMSDLEGCISIGMNVGDMKGQRALINSSQATVLFNYLTVGSPFEITIEGKY